MSSPSPTVSPEALLAHASWVERLVRKLVFDPAHADDVVQATWLEALEHPPRDERNLRGWLATVVRHAVRRSARGERRRRRREELAARPEGIADTAELVERAVLHRDMVNRVIALDEPYRSVILQRFFEDRSTTEIAERLGRPRNTVQTQLQRGLARLHQQLDDEYGGREHWGFALLPLAGARGSAAGVAHGSLTVLLGGWIMTWKALAVAATLVLVALGTWKSEPASPLESVAGGDVAPARQEPDATPAVSEPPPREPQRVALEATEAAPPPPAAEPDTVRLAGVVVDTAGTPRAAFELRWNLPGEPRLEGDVLHSGDTTVRLQPGMLDQLRENPAFLAELSKSLPHSNLVRALILEGQPAREFLTDSSGRFTIDVPGLAPVTLEPRAADMMILDEGWRQTGPGERERERIVVVSRAVAAGGRVVDGDGAPIEGAYVSTGVSVESLSSFPFVLESDSYRSWSSTTDTDGHFSFQGLPALASVDIVAQKRGYRALRIPIPAASDDALELVLEEKSGRRFVTGQVLFANGTPAPETRVTLGQDGASTDASGAFRIEISYLVKGSALLATKRGHQAALVPGFADDYSADASLGDDVVLRLGGPPKTIRGRVLDADGAPVEGMSVSVIDGTQVGTSSASVEQGDETGADGRFELTELLGRDYQVRAFDEDSFLVVESAAVPAGTRDLELRLPRDPLHAELHGRVVSGHGAPVANASVAITFYTHRTARSSSSRGGRSAQTDADGEFVLGDVPRRHVFLRASGKDIESAEVDVEGIDPDLPLTIEVLLIQRFRVEPAEGEVADGYEFHDATGRRVRVDAHFPNVVNIHERVPLRAGRPVPTCEVTEEAVELVLFRGDEELRRISLELRPGEITTLRP